MAKKIKKANVVIGILVCILGILMSISYFLSEEAGRFYKVILYIYFTFSALIIGNENKFKFHSQMLNFTKKNIPLFSVWLYIILFVISSFIYHFTIANYPIRLWTAIVSIIWATFNVFILFIWGNFKNLKSTND